MAKDTVKKNTPDKKAANRKGTSPKVSANTKRESAGGVRAAGRGYE